MRHLGMFAVAALSIVFARGASAQSLSITSYQLVSQQVVNATQSQMTYSAVLTNSSGAFGSVTATVSSTNPFSVRTLSGESTLNFAPVPANSQVPSSNTFTILVSNTVPFSFSALQWTFQTTAVGPIANAGPNQTVTVGSTVMLNGSGSSNPSGIGTLSYSWVFSSRPPGTHTTLLNTQAFNPSFVADVAGTYVVTLTVSNGSASSSASVAVNTVSSPPVANAGPNQTVALGSTVTLNGSGSTDIDGNPLSYLWTLTSVPSGSAAVLSGPSSVSPTFIADKFGSYTAQLIVKDGSASSAPATVTITTQDTPPVANAGPGQVVAVGTLVQLNGSGSTDVNGDPLTYQWSLITLPVGSAATLTNFTAVNPTFTADVAGTYVAQLIVNDGTYNSNPSTVSISTNSILPPTANAGPSQTVGCGANASSPCLQGTTVQLSGSGTDPQGLSLTYQWALLSKPSGSNAVLSGTTIANPTFVADLSGTYVAQLIVNNGYLSSVPSTVTISTSNTAPVSNPGPNQTVTVGSAVTLNGSGSADADGDSLTYSWALLSRPSGSAAVIVPVNTVSPKFLADVIGTYVVQLIVSDGVVNSDPATVTITANAPTAIVLTPNPLNIASNASGVMVLTLSAPAGTGGQAINLTSSNASASTVPQNVTVPPGATSVNVIVTPVAAGTTTITGSAVGFTSGTTTVNVSTPAISLTPNPLSFGNNTTGTLTVTLSSPAGAGGQVINFTSSNPNIAVVPASVTISQGGVSANVTVTPGTGGTTTITASATGFTAGTATVNIANVAQILLQANVTVPPNQSVTFPVTLVSPAPAGGIFVSLASSNTGIVTLSTSSVYIQQGQTTPSKQPQVTGVTLGSAIITASATGLTPATQQVTVAENISFLPATLTITQGNSQVISLSLSGAAPTSITINLSSSNPSVATVPATIIIPANTTTVAVKVTSVAVGSAVIQASDLPIITATTASVTVQAPPAVQLPSFMVLGQWGDSGPIPVSLSAPAPAGGVTVTLSSSSTGYISISPAQVFIPFGATTPATQPTITGDNIGVATITASAPGYTTASLSIDVFDTITIGLETGISVTAGQSIPFYVCLTGAAPAGGLTITFTTSNSAEATITSSVFVPAGSMLPTTYPQLTGVSAGTVNITASAAGYSSHTVPITVVSQ